MTVNEGFWLGLFGFPNETTAASLKAMSQSDIDAVMLQYKTDRISQLHAQQDAINAELANS